MYGKQIIKIVSIVAIIIIQIIQINKGDDNVTSSSDIIQLHIVFRHGQRAPTETYNNDPYKNMTWSGGWGHLTNRGKLEMYSLGRKLKEIYKDFITDYYFPNKVRILSSYSDRCIMSAQALLAAVYPPKGDQIWNENLLWQPIPIHYLPRNEDKLIAMKAPCKKYDEQLEAILKSDKIRLLNEENSELFSYLTKNTGQLIDNIGSVESLYNTLEIELLHNLSLPEWTKNVSLDHMKTLAARYLEILTETHYMKRMKGGVFVKEVISTMKRTANSDPILYLYAGHDVTLVNILKTLGYQPTVKPGFGASFVLELRRNLEIKMIYRNDIEDDPIEIAVPNCKTSCLLYDFEVSYEALIPLDWEAECK